MREPKLLTAMLIDQPHCIFQSWAGRRVAGVFEKTAHDKHAEIARSEVFPPPAGHVFVDEMRGLLHLGSQPMGVISYEPGDWIVPPYWMRAEVGKPEVARVVNACPPSDKQLADTLRQAVKMTNEAIRLMFEARRNCETAGLEVDFEATLNIASNVFGTGLPEPLITRPVAV